MDPLLESQNARDARVERLWRQLDTLKKGELDLVDLRRGLKKIDHREPPVIDFEYLTNFDYSVKEC
jgi:hypothetical protein